MYACTQLRTGLDHMATSHALLLLVCSVLLTFLACLSRGEAASVSVAPPAFLCLRSSAREQLMAEATK